MMLFCFVYSEYVVSYFTEPILTQLKLSIFMHFTLFSGSEPVYKSFFEKKRQAFTVVVLCDLPMGGGNLVSSVKCSTVPVFLGFYSFNLLRYFIVLRHTKCNCLSQSYRSQQLEENYCNVFLIVLVLYTNMGNMFCRTFEMQILIPTVGYFPGIRPNQSKLHILQVFSD